MRAATRDGVRRVGERKYRFVTVVREASAAEDGEKYPHR